MFKTGLAGNLGRPRRSAAANWHRIILNAIERLQAKAAWLFI
jgi:hypothetical protein